MTSNLSASGGSPNRFVIGDAASIGASPKQWQSGFWHDDSFDGEHGQEWFLSLRNASKPLQHLPRDRAHPQSRFPRRSRGLELMWLKTWRQYMVIGFDQGHAFLVKITLFGHSADLIKVVLIPSSGSDQTSNKSAFVICLALLGKWNTALSGSGTHSLNRDQFPTCQAPVPADSTR